MTPLDKKKQEFVYKHKDEIKKQLPNIKKSYPNGLSDLLTELETAARKEIGYSYKVAICEILWTIKKVYEKMEKDGSL